MKLQKVLLATSIAFILFITAACSIFPGYSRREKAYYRNPDHYISAQATVKSMLKRTDYPYIDLTLIDLSPDCFSGNTFRIHAKSVEILENNGFFEKVSPGDRIEIITAPRYFADGWSMPIVGLSVNGECLLSFEDGFANWIDWMSNR